MPKGPQGQTRPADAIGCAVAVGRIATGEAEEVAYAAPGRKVSGQLGGAARARKMSEEDRSTAAKVAAGARWKEGRVDMSEQSRLMRALFEHPGRTHVDIKFFRGASNNVTSEQVCREANSAIFQIDTGVVDGDLEFAEDFKQVDVAEIVKAL